jgi:phospholipase/carboxylesterase
MLAAISRRRFSLLAGNLVASCFVCGGCDRHERPPSSTASSTAILKARPSAASTVWAAGTHVLGLGDARDALLQLPANAGEDLLPLIVLFHGAGGSGERFLRRIAAAAEGLRIALLAPDSRGRTWDAVLSEQTSLLDIVTGHRQVQGFGLDVAFLDRALERVFQKVAVDPTRIAVGGFSDGATYALSLGLINGDLFRRIVAFSPGFWVEGESRGHPQIYVSHGRADEILPIDRSSRRIVPELEKRGYTVTYREFDGGHEVPEGIAREALGGVIGQ